MSKSIRYLIILILAILIPLGFFATEFMSVSSFGYTESISVAELMEEAGDVLDTSYLSDEVSLGIVFLIGIISLIVIVAVLNIIFAIARSKYGVFVSSIIGICLTGFMLFVFYIAALEMGSEALLKAGTSPWLAAIGFVATLVFSATERKTPATVSSYDVLQQAVTPKRVAPGTGWRCTKCGRKNDETSKFCSLCGSVKNNKVETDPTPSKPKPTVVTPQQVHTPQQVVTPQYVYTPQQAVTPKRVAPGTGWRCTKCGRKNDETSKFCSLCGSVKNNKVEKNS